jgi:hypothetical protein
MSMGDGKQKVWFFSNKTSFGSSANRDAAAAELVNNLGKKGFSFEGAVENDSLTTSSYDDTSYVYTMQKNSFVYKVAVTKRSYADLRVFSFGFDIKVVVLKDGFEELPSTDFNSLRFETDLPEEMNFLNDFATHKSKGSWNDSLRSTYWVVYCEVDKENLTTEKMDNPPNEEKMKALADSVEKLKLVLKEKGLVLNKVDSTEMPTYYYTYETDLAKYEVTVVVDAAKKGDAVILGNWYYDYAYNIKIVTYYKKSAKRLR